MHKLLPLLWILTLHAEEGMWTFNRFPSEKVRAQYGFSPSTEWLDHVRLASVRLAGCSASLVGPGGLVMTNQHCAAACILAVSTKERDYSANGFQAKSQSEELRCPGEEANILENIATVTARIAAATRRLQDQAANDARKAEIAKIEKECATGDNVRCQVVALYGGGVYDLYKYRRYPDVRLVFAPEFAVAFFGGDPDNFMFPRYSLDVSFLRIYENGQPLETPHYFRFSRTGAKEGEVVFIAGNPGSTNRQHTVAMIENERDFLNPHWLTYLAEYRGLLTMFQTRGEEQRRVSQDELMLGVENALKVSKGAQEALLQASFFAQKQREEADFQKRVQADPKLRTAYGAAWNEAAKAVTQLRAHHFAYLYFEMGFGFRSALFRHARRLLRMAEEYPQANEKRLAEFADARKPQMAQWTLSPAPIYPELEIETLTYSLSKLREEFTPDDPRVRQILGKQSPRELATAAVNGSRLSDPAVRKTLMEGGMQAVDASTDPMIALARLADPIAREARRSYEDEVESVLTRAKEKLAQARFAVYGESLYPDATFTLRLNYGQVKGWVENAKTVPPFTVFEGAFTRATGRPPYALPKSWLDARSKLNLQTPLNFVTTNDTIGGNSGSPVINKDLQIVGLMFDGNIHSLGGRYGFDESMNRTVSVHSSAILEALEKIYGANRVLAELASGFAWEKQTEDAFRAALVEGKKALDEARYAEAERIFLRSMNLAQPFGPEDVRVAYVLNALGTVYVDQSRIGDAEAAFRRAAGICDRAQDCGSHHAAVLANLASTYKVQGRVSEAVAMFRRVLAVEEGHGEPFRPEFARVLVSYADLMSAMGRFSEAEKLSRRAIRILEQSAGQEGQLAYAYAGLGVILYDAKRFAEAERACLEAIAFGDRALSADHLWQAGSQLRLGMIYRATGRLAEAEIRFRSSLEIARKGDSAIRTGAVLHQLALLLVMRSQHGEAERCFRESIELGRATFGPDHPDVVLRLQGYATLLRKMKRKPEAREIEKEAELAQAKRGDTPSHTIDVQTLRSSGREGK